MREDSCIGCLFSEDDGMTMILKDLPGISQETMRCVHPDSPYYEELVFEDYSCRQYVNAKEYFKMRDRQENLDEIKEKIRRKKLGL
jgi:hypothetical protein